MAVGIREPYALAQQMQQDSPNPAHADPVTYVAYAEYVDGDSYKFYEIIVAANTATHDFRVARRWGRIGSEGSYKTEFHPSLLMATSSAVAQFDDKVREGYVATGVSFGQTQTLSDTQWNALGVNTYVTQELQELPPELDAVQRVKDSIDDCTRFAADDEPDVTGSFIALGQLHDRQERLNHVIAILTSDAEFARLHLQARTIGVAADQQT